MKTQFINRRPIKWRIDEDGNLRVTIEVLTEGVFEYGREETPFHEGLSGLDVVREYIPASEMKKEAAIKSLEGKNLIVGTHDWQTPGNYEESDIVGSVAGTPYVENGTLFCEGIVKCPVAIERITSDRVEARDRLVEVSAGYDGDLEVAGGIFNGEQYDARQCDFRFNHILLLPEGKGRCGVKIVNIKPTEGAMAGARTLKVRIGNTDRTFRFSNEEDAKEAEDMLEEERKFNAEAVESAMGEKEKLSAQIDELKAQLEEHNKTLLQAKADLERAVSEETQEVLAAEMNEQAEDESAIANAEAADGDDGSQSGIENAEEEEKKKEEFLNSIRTGKDGKRATLSMRRENAVRQVMGKRGTEIPSTWDAKAFDAAFEVIAVNARMQNEKRAKEAANTQARVLNGKKTPGVNPQLGDTRSRMLNAMRVKKTGTKGGSNA